MRQTHAVAACDTNGPRTTSIGPVMEPHRSFSFLFHRWGRTLLASHSSLAALTHSFDSLVFQAREPEECVRRGHVLFVRRSAVRSVRIARQPMGRFGSVSVSTVCAFAEQYVMQSVGASVLARQLGLRNGILVGKCLCKRRSHGEARACRRRAERKEGKQFGSFLSPTPFSSPSVG